MDSLSHYSTVDKVLSRLGTPTNGGPVFNFRQFKPKKTTAGNGITFYVASPPSVILNKQVQFYVTNGSQYPGLSIRYKPDNLIALTELTRQFINYINGIKHTFDESISANLKDYRVKVEGIDILNLIDNPSELAFMRISVDEAKKCQESKRWIFTTYDNSNSDEIPSNGSDKSVKEYIIPVDVNELFDTKGISICKYTSGVILSGEYNYCRLSFGEKTIFISCRQNVRLVFNREDEFEAGGSKWIVRSSNPNNNPYPSLNNSLPVNPNFIPYQNTPQYAGNYYASNIPQPVSMPQYVKPNQFNTQQHVNPANPNQYNPQPVTTNASQYNPQPATINASQYNPQPVSINTNQYNPQQGNSNGMNQQPPKFVLKPPESHNNGSYTPSTYSLN